MCKVRGCMPTRSMRSWSRWQPPARERRCRSSARRSQSLPLRERMRNPAVRCRALRCGQPRDSSRSLARLKAMNTRTTQPTDKRLLACFGKGGGVPQLRGGSQAETFVSNGWTATSSPPIRAASSVISIEVPGVTAQPAIVGPETFLSSAVARRRPTSCLNRGWMGPTVRTEPGARSEAAAQRQICAGQRQGSPDAGKTTRASSKG